MAAVCWHPLRVHQNLGPCSTPGAASAWIPCSSAVWAQPGSRTRGLAEGSAWDVVPSHASSPQVPLGEQKAQCHSPHAVPPPICCPCWDPLGGRTLVPPGPLVSLQELQGGAGTWCDMETQVPRLTTPSSCGKGLGSGWWAVAVAGGKGGEPRALAVLPLTHSPVETEIFPRLIPPAPHHPGLGTAAPRAGRVHLQTPVPWQHPWHSMAGRRWLSWLGSAQPDAGAFSVSLWMYSQAGWEPGAPAHSSPQPQGHLCPGAPRTAGAEPCGAAPASRHCLYSWSSSTRAAWGQVLPQTGQQNRHSGPGAGGCPGQTWAIHEASGTRHFPARPHSGGLVVTRCTRHAARTQPRRASSSQCTCAGHGTAEGTGTCPGGHSQAPCPTKHLACPSMSRCPHIPLRAETRVSAVVALRAAAKDHPEGGR